jgi:hypothetical protein
MASSLIHHSPYLPTSRKQCQQIHPTQFSSAFPSREVVLQIRHPCVSTTYLNENDLTKVQVEWDAAKEKALWKILSKASKNSDIDCTFLTLPFFNLLVPLEHQLTEACRGRTGSQIRRPAPVPSPTDSMDLRKTTSAGSRTDA